MIDWTEFNCFKCQQNYSLSHGIGSEFEGLMQAERSMSTGLDTAHRTVDALAGSTVRLCEDHLKSIARLARMDETLPLSCRDLA